MFDVIEASGAAALLIERFALEYHAPWHLDRDVSHLLRGRADAAEADAVLTGAGHDDLRLVDNGAIVAPMPGIPRPHAFHLVPRDVSKARAVAFHMLARGYAAEDCIAIGDSRRGPRGGLGGRDVLACGQRGGGSVRGAERARLRGRPWRGGL